MDETPPDNSPTTEIALPSDPDLMLGSESQWKSASMSPKTPKLRSSFNSTAETHIKAEEDELEEIDAVVWVPSPRSKSAEKGVAQTQIKAEDSELEEIDAAVWSFSRAGSAAQTPRKRPRSHSVSMSRVKLEDDVQPKVESSDFSTSDERRSPSKRRKSFWGKNIPFDRGVPHRTTYPEFPRTPELMDQTKSSRTPTPDGKDSGSGETEYEYDLENSDFSDIEDDDTKPSVAPDPLPPQKKRTREKSVKTSEEWWARSYRKKAKFQKRRNRRTFANDGAASKIHNFLNHDPIAAHKEKPAEEQTPNIEASSKRDYFDQVLRNIRTDGRVHNCRGDKTALKIAGESFGRANVKYRNENTWSLKGVKTALYHHQLICASWMLGREYDPDRPSGGFNCDVMGLGKTLEMLATIIGNPRPKGAERSEIGPTLIVVPSSISAQWVSEIGKHLADGRLNVILYAKSQKLSRNTLIKSDLVVTSYDQMRMSSPYPPPWWLLDLAKKLKLKDCTLDGRKSIEEWIDNNREEYGDVLHKINWYRIVLDEAHHIKNHESKTSYAASALLGKYRWLMTGTPMMNKREELYSYFRFLKHAGTSSLAVFKRDYCDHKSSACNSRLDELLSHLVIRRSMQAQILGKELITLPTPHRENSTESFRLATRNLYRAVESKFREIIMQQEFKDDDPRKKMKYLIVMILRLRQFTASPLAIEPQVKALFTAEELQSLRKDMKGTCPALHDRMGIWISSLKSGHRGSSIGNEALDVHICEICNQEADDPRQVRNYRKGRNGQKSCDHIFCKTCIELSINAQVARTDNIECPANDCGRKFNPDRMLSLDSWSMGPEEDSSMKRGRDALGFSPRLSVRSEWLEEFNKGKAELPHTPKVEAIKQKLRSWRQEAPSDKIVIFIQWKLMMRLIGIMLEEENYNFLYYTGEMKGEDRAHTLREFERNPKFTILIIGLKVGGVGLNLAFANRAIMVDLWWNAATESQANGRIFRIGQEKETNFVRFMMRESVDIRLLRMQVFKSIIIDGTLEGKTELTWAEALSFLGEVKWGEF
ncbi:hypothetical protein OCU04_010327 [Sclerotinia nivalis]|uniref:DNA repair protein rad5 n=1 Tax=Sclerotinia nivalis TaxID=352851 RepID=A0A9X0AEB4_9HELO|nr:hypothetical protein OCU04_010327 [Sclerotinia nivalis]